MAIAYPQILVRLGLFGGGVYVKARECYEITCLNLGKLFMGLDANVVLSFRMKT